SSILSLASRIGAASPIAAWRIGESSGTALPAACVIDKPPRMCVEEAVFYPEAYPISGRPPIWNGVQLSYGSGGRLPRAKGQLSLRVFGRLPVTARGAARRQASEKPRRRKPRGEYAPAAVSAYGRHSAISTPTHGRIRRGATRHCARITAWSRPA